MFFGTRSYQTPQRGVPRQVPRQIIFLVTSLAVVLLAVRFLPSMKRRTGDEPAPAPPSGFGRDVLEAPVSPTTEPSATSLAPPLEPQPPEPWAENPRLLARAAAVDRTSEFDDTLIAHLLQKVRTRGEAFPTDTPVLDLDRDARTWNALLDRPDAYRGALVRVEGEVLAPPGSASVLRLRGIDFPNPSGLDRAFQSFLIGRDGRYYMVATVRASAELAHRDPVRLRGYFAQLYSYPVEYKEEMRLATIPLLVGDAYERLERPEIPSRGGNNIVLIAILGGVALVFAFAVDAMTGRRRRRLAPPIRRPEPGPTSDASRNDDILPLPPGSEVPDPDDRAGDGA